ncbi:hypothetical protein ACU6YE_01835 [Klebsiella aerogenes]
MVDKQYSLQDFIGFQEHSLEDFSSSLPDDGNSLVTSAPSDRNTSAYTALLNAPNNPEQAAQTYINVNDEYALNGYSQTHEEVVDVRKSQEMDAYRNAAVSSLIDPNSSTESKAATVGYVNNPAAAHYSTQGMVLSQEAAIPADGETLEANKLRAGISIGIEQALEYQREKQRIYNEHATKERESGNTASWVGLAEDLAPFVEAFKTSKLYAETTGDKATATGGILLPGELKQGMVDKFNALPLDKRIEFMEKLSATIQADGKTILLPNDIDRGNLHVLQEITESGSYTVTDRTIDNVFGLMNIVGLGSFLGKLTKGSKAAESVAAAEKANDLSRSWERRMIVDDTQPASVATMLKDANPERMRQLHLANEKALNDEVALAIHGTDKDSALASNLSPQPMGVDGGAQSKTYLPEKYSDFDKMPDADVIDFVSNTSAPNLSIAEKRALRATVANDFQNVSGMVNRKEMTTIGEYPDAGHIIISASYGPTDSGFSSIQDAIEQAKYALRNYAVDDKDISILMRQGDEYLPIPKDTQALLLKGNNTQIKGDYLLQINKQHAYSAGDLAGENFEKFGVAAVFNAFNRTGWFSGKHGAGSAVSHVVDPSILFNPNVVKGAQLADMHSDALTAKILDTAKPFMDAMKNVKPERRLEMENILREANAKGIELNSTFLTSRGFNTEERIGIESFRRTQDTIWKLTNDDMVKTYQRNGYGRLTMKEAGLDVIAKEVSAGSVAGNTRVYDPLTDEVRMMSKEDIAEHYSNNGNIVETAHPITINGKEVEHILNPNHQTSGYLRALADGESVMAYRKGYYSVRYKDPHFIMQKVIDPDTGKAVRDAHGREKFKAVATAANIPDAQAMIERLKATKGGEYEFRNNLKGEEYDRAYTQMNTAGGMSSQRFRGQRLEDSTGTNAEFGAHIDSPAESLARSISAISSRVSYRDWIETNKQRLFNAYKEVMPMKEGHPVYPSNVTDIKGHSRAAADARATFEYIRMMENGYVNALDDGYKAVINLMADSLGAKGFGNVEQKLRNASTASFSATPKRIVFDMMIALNPLRQMMVQTGQAAMILTRFPAYTGRIVQDSNLLLLSRMNKKLPENVYKAMGRDKEAFEKMLQGLDESGINKGIQNHELVKSLVDSTVDASVASMKAASPSAASKMVSAPLTAYKAITTAGRKIGFDAGEWMVQSTSYMAHWDAAVKAGKDVTSKAVRDEIAYQARNFTGNFSRSGSLALNNNALSVVTQFMQVPLKMFGLLFNKGIPLKARATMGVSAALLFGTPFDIGSDIYKAITGEKDLPENDLARQFITDGLITAAGNAFINSLFGEKSTIDFGGSLSPYDPSGLADLLTNAYKGGIAEILPSTPAGSLVAGTNPRVANVISSFGRAMGYGEIGDTTSIERVGLLASDIGKLSSGYSNAMKALQALAYHKSYSAGGTVLSDDLPTPDAIAKAFGFQSLQDVHKFDLNSYIKDVGKDKKADVLASYDYFHRLFTRDGSTVEELQYALDMSHQMMSVYKDDPAAMEIWHNEFERRIKAGDTSLLEALRKFSGLATPEQLDNALDKSDLPPEQKKLLRQWYNMDLSGFNSAVATAD